MITDFDMVQSMARQHRDELLDRAERQRLLTAARRYRRQARRRET
jgi:hypothetical protein